MIKGHVEDLKVREVGGKEQQNEKGGAPGAFIVPGRSQI